MFHDFLIWLAQGCYWLKPSSWGRLSKAFEISEVINLVLSFIIAFYFSQNVKAEKAEQ